MKKLFYLSTIFLSLFIIVNSCSESGTESTPIYSLSVTADPAEAGSVSPSSGEYEQGESVEITASPNDGWMFDRWQGDHTGSSNPASVTMSSDKQITARFVERTYPLTTNTDGEGTIQERVVSQKTTDYEDGTVVELTAEPADGWRFVEWQGDLEGSENPVTIEVDSEKSVTAVFERRDYPLTVNIVGEGTVAEEVIQAKTTDYPYETNVQLTANPAEGWVFSRWEGDVTGSENPTTVEITNEKTVTAVFERETFAISYTLNGEGQVTETLSTGTQAEDGSYEYGSTVELTAVPTEGWQFTGWGGDVQGTENPQTITIDSDKSITANFERRDYPLTVNIQGEGTVAEEVIQAKTTDYPYETNVQLTATAAEGWVFARWEGDVTGTDNPATVEVTNEKTVTAVFERDYFPLELLTEGEGTAEASLAAGNQNEEGLYEFGSTVDLSSTASTGWQFIGWSGLAESAENPTTIEIGTDNSVTASFERQEFTLTVTTDGGGSVAESLLSGTETEAGYLYESQIELTATADEGWEFVEWTGDITGTDNPSTITVDADKNITAVFEEISYSLNIIVEGSGLYDAALLSGSAVGDGYSYGSEVEVTVTPDAGWNFVHWSGDLNGTDNPITVTIQSDLSTTANLDNSPFAGGNGSELYPYQVSTVEQLQAIRNYTDKHFVQINDIDASETEIWNGGEGFEPISDDIVRFGGDYDGKEYQIINLFINRNSDNASIFGISNSAVFKNINLVNLFVHGGSNVGGLLGQAIGTEIINVLVNGNIEGDNSVGGLIGRFENSTLLNSNSSGVIKGNNRVGGIIGTYLYGLTENSHSSSTVTGDDFIGGLIGGNTGFGTNGSITVKNSSATGNVLGKTHVGGLAGGFIWDGITIIESFATGNATGNLRIGGLIGTNEFGIINNSFSSGAVSGDEDVGGLGGLLVGHLYESFSSSKVNGNLNVGGLVGRVIQATIEKSYSSNEVSGSSHVGGLVGFSENSVISFAYSMSKIEGDDDVGGLIGTNTSDSTLEGSYYAGILSGNINTGGIVGSNGGNLLKNYWDYEVSTISFAVGRGTSEGATGLTTSEMQGSPAQQNMPEFDWINIWITTDSYPILRWQQETN